MQEPQLYACAGVVALGDVVCTARPMRLERRCALPGPAWLQSAKSSSLPWWQGANPYCAPWPVRQQRYFTLTMEQHLPCTVGKVRNTAWGANLRHNRG